MTRFLLALAFLAGLSYLYRTKHRSHPPVEVPPPPPAIGFETTPAVSEAELVKVRAATKDAEASVRWAAIELLFRMRDPQAIAILENMLALDTEPTVRRNALDILRTTPKPTAIKDLLLALRDQEKDIRVAALLALGELGDSSIAPQVTELLKDSDSDVRLQALHALGRLQDIKHAQFQSLADKLRAQYEQAARRAKENAARSGQQRDAPQPK